MEWWDWEMGKVSNDDVTYNGIKNKYREKLEGKQLQLAKAGRKFDEDDIEVDTVTGQFGTVYNPDKYDYYDENVKIANERD